MMRLASIPRRHPFAFGVGVSAVKTVTADTMAQLYLEDAASLDTRRSAIFLAWGALYLGGVQYFI